MLVGLNDTNLQQNSLIQNLQTCFATLSPETTPLSYKNLFAGDNSNNEGFQRLQFGQDYLV